MKKFKPFDRCAEPTLENMEKLNSIRSFYYAYEDSGLPPKEITPEFHKAVGEVLMGKRLRGLELRYTEFEW